MNFNLPDLPYDFSALEPYIDAKTMEIHHGKHHATYIAKLNDAIKGTALEEKTLEDLLKNHSTNKAVRNNGGGHWNHSLFWTILSAKGEDPKGEMLQAINTSFGSFNNFKEQFSNAATTRFGSGWAWLCKKSDGTLNICSTANQDNPLMPDAGCEGIPILGLDVWEHAYYLNYQNRRPDYIKAFFNVINWDQVNARFNDI